MTGKTYTLTQQAERAALKHGGHNVVIASLTRTAAAEVASRAQTIPLANVGTLHALASRVLGRPGLADSPEGLKLWNERVPRESWTIGRHSGVDPENAPLEQAQGVSDGDRLYAEMGIMRARMLPVEKWRVPVQNFCREWLDFMEDADRIDFSGLLERCLAEVPAAPGYPRVFMADEAQDFSALEFALARKWGEQAETFVLVGDPDQCLYEWRGSNPLTFSEGEPAGVRVLSQSRRVPEKVCTYAHGWIQRISDREPITYEPRFNDPDDPSSGVAVGELLHSRHTYRYPAPLIRLMREDMRDGKSVMMLTSCSYMLKALLHELRERGIPYHNPYRVQHGGWNPLRHADRVAAFLKPQPVENGGQNMPWTWGDVALWTEPLRAAGTLTRGSKVFIEAKCLPERFAPVQPIDREADLQTIYADDGLLKPEHHDSVYAGDLDWYVGHTRASRMNVVEYPVRVAQTFGGGALLERPQLIVGTIHSVKGGEADSVYIFPDLSRQGGIAWGMRGANRYPIIRQFYVGFTRARTKLTLCSPSAADHVPFPRNQKAA